MGKKAFFYCLKRNALTIEDVPVCVVVCSSWFLRVQTTVSGSGKSLFQNPTILEKHIKTDIQRHIISQMVSFIMYILKYIKKCLFTIWCNKTYAYLHFDAINMCLFTLWCHAFHDNDDDQFTFYSHSHRLADCLSAK